MSFSFGSHRCLTGRMQVRTFIHCPLAISDGFQDPGTPVLVLGRVLRLVLQGMEQDLGAFHEPLGPLQGRQVPEGPAGFLVAAMVLHEHIAPVGELLVPHKAGSTQVPPMTLSIVLFVGGLQVPLVLEQLRCIMVLPVPVQELHGAVDVAGSMSVFRILQALWHRPIPAL